ncbi:MAG: hypothetical protein INH41_13275 [Myxococcaceae bacterium]|nr:hypothetical protein [Myxococcaceae bacterium]MCA3013352.1 hypothetical protein [Myxococcaceae bacterium]
MDVVLRPVNDSFLKKVVFPAFELGVVDATPGLEFLLKHLNDEATRVLLEMLLEHAVDGSFFGLTDHRWSEAVYRLLFFEWLPDSDGWIIANQYMGYAGPWTETFHLALMLEDPQYPYADDEQADQFRRGFWSAPRLKLGLSTLLTGTWDPVPNFPPDQVLTVEGAGVYDLKAGVARADWAWRPKTAVGEWAARMPSALSGLLDRESRRLRPISAPEKHDVLDFWLGRTSEPPLLAVSFSGLGSRANEWIREIGALARVVRKAANAQQGVTAVITRRGRTMDNLIDER